MLEQRFTITIANQDNTFTTQLLVRSRQLFRSVKYLISSQLRQLNDKSSPLFVCIFNGRKLEEEDILEDIGIMEGSIITIYILDENDKESDIDLFIESLSKEDGIDKQLSRIYEYIDKEEIIEAFEIIKSRIFSMQYIPVVIDRLRYRFSQIPYNPNIFVIVHELLYQAITSKQDRDTVLALLLWYKTVVSKILTSQENVSIVMIMSIINEYMEDLQIIIIALSIVELIMKETTSVFDLLSEETNITSFFACMERWEDVKVIDMVLSIFHMLISHNTTFLEQIDEKMLGTLLVQVVKQANSAMITSQVMNIYGVLLEQARFANVLESTGMIYVMREQVNDPEQGVFITKCFCSFLMTVTSQPLANAEKIKRQILFTDVYPLFMKTATQATYDIQFLVNLLTLSKQMCSNNDFCVYLTNNGLFDFIQTCLTLRCDSEQVFTIAFQCYSEMILNSWICRERVLSLATIEVLFILIDRDTCSVPVINAFCQLLQLINSYEIGQNNLRIACAVDYLKRLDESFKEVEKVHVLLQQLIEDIPNASPKISASEISNLYISPKLNRLPVAMDIKRRDGARRASSNSSLKRGLPMRRPVSTDSSCEITFNVGSESNRELLSDGSDLYSTILTELDCLPDVTQCKRLVHCLYFLLDPGLFSEIVVYLNVSLFPAVLARVADKYIDDEELCLYVATIISTISQKKAIDLLIKGDVIELLVKLLREHNLNYLITGYSLYSLYQLTQMGDCLERLTGAGTIKCLQALVQNTHDLFIRGYAIKTIQLLGEEVPESLIQEHIDVEDGLVGSLLSLLTKNRSSPKKIVEYLDLFINIFKIDYIQLQRAFFVHKGILRLEQLIKEYASDSVIVGRIVEVFSYIAKNLAFSHELEESEVTAIAIQILLRYPKDKKMVKNALNIIRCLCVYSSTASILTHYTPQLKTLFVQYSKSSSICECIIHILVLLSKIGEQSRLTILRSNILHQIDTVVFLHTSRISLLSNLFTLFYELSESSYGCNCLIENRCYDICLKIIQHIIKEKVDGKEDIIEMAISVIERTLEKGNDSPMRSILFTSGYTILMDCYEAEVSNSIKRSLLNCLTLLLQHEEGNETLASLQFLQWLFKPSHFNTSISTAQRIWICCHTFIQFHVELVLLEDVLVIVKQIAHQCNHFIDQELIVTTSVATLFSLASSSPLFVEMYVDHAAVINDLLMNVNKRYRTNEIIQHQLNYIETVIVSNMGSEAVTTAFVDKTQQMVESIDQSLQNPALQQREKESLLDLLLEICNSHELLHYISFTTLPSTLLALFTNDVVNDRQNEKILSIFSSLKHSVTVEESVMLQLLKNIQSRLEASSDLSSRFLLNMVLYIEIACTLESCCEFIMTSSIIQDILTLAGDPCLEMKNSLVSTLLECTQSTVFEENMLMIQETLDFIEIDSTVTSLLFTIRCQLLHSLIHLDEVPVSVFGENFYQYLLLQQDELDVMEACSLCGFVVKSDTYRAILGVKEYLDWFAAILTTYPENESILNCITVVICELSNHGVTVNVDTVAFLFVNCQLEYKETLLRCLARLLIQPDLPVFSQTILLIHEGVRMIQITSTNCMTVLTVLYNLLKRADASYFNSICEIMYETILQFSLEPMVLDFLKMVVMDSSKIASLHIALNRYNTMYALQILRESTERTIGQVLTIIRLFMTNEITVMLLLENGFERDMADILTNYNENAPICILTGLLVLEVLRYQKPYKRLLRNTTFIQLIESFYSKNNEVIDVFLQITNVIKNGFGSLETQKTNEQVFIDRYGPVPNKPPPPLPIGCKM